MNILTSLSCMFGLGCSAPVVYYHEFGDVLASSVSQDGDMLIFNGMRDPGYSFENVSSFVVGDDKLQRFLGVSSNSAVILEMYKNVTDFNVYDFCQACEFPWGDKVPKDFVQPSGLNKELDLEYASEIFSDDVQITLVYEDLNAAKSLSKMMTKLSYRFPRVSFRCWDIIESDIGIHDFEYPAIVVSSKAHEDSYYALQPPITLESFSMFIEANLIKNDQYKNSKKLNNKQALYKSEL